MVGDDAGEITLRAFPGPIKWTATNLPKGIKLEPDKEDSTIAVLSGTYTAARAGKTTNDKHYTIKAENTNYSKAGTISADLMVYPELSFKTKEDKAIAMKTGTATEFKIELVGFPNAASYDVTLNGVKMLEQKTGTYYVGGQQKVSADAMGKTFISLDLAALSKDPTVLVFKGSWDRMPDDSEVPLVITARGPVTTDSKKNEVTGNFTVKVTGVQAKFPSTKDIKLVETDGWSKDLKLAEGTPSIDMEATIDASTAKKIFGAEDAITLKKDTVDPYSGLSFDHDGLGKFTFYISSDMHMAYNKLPVTVTAKNEKVSEKATTGKLTITVAGNDPVWKVSNDLQPLGASDKFAAGLGVNGQTAKLLLDAGAANPFSDDSYVVFIMSGDNPVVYNVKPEEKNGITATVDKAAKTVTFKKTDDLADKKDVTTKFTLSAKNNSTGKEAKLTVEITAAPKPEIDDSEAATKKLSATGEYGKNLKVAPKLKKTNKNVKWVITEVSTDANYSGWTTLSGVTDHTDYSADADGGKNKLKDRYGLTFDSKKGAISGKMKYATGADKSLNVTMVASGSAVSSDPVIAKFTVKGAKPKLKTKTATITQSSGAWATDTSNKVETSFKTTTSLTLQQASVDLKIDTDGKVPEDVGTIGFTYNATHDNTFGLDGKPAKVVKKMSIPVILSNYGTEQKGKLAVVVKGDKPTIAVDGTVPGVTAGEDEVTAAIKITNPDYVSEKVKWKITTKPSASGVSAKIKADDSTGATATLTLKATKKASAGGTSVKIQATDSITKEESEILDVSFTVAAAPTDTIEAKDLADNVEATEPEATTETENETVAEETAVGEGEVKLGRERTVAGLTAAQRTFFAENGYVVAAVLPEIEVEGAGGQYEFEVDELEEAAKTGAELVWFAFASKPTEDDEIVEFYDADNDAEAIKVIPESRKLIVAPWLNVGTKYAPVIAVKADAAEAEATTEEDVKAKAEEKAEEAAAEGEAETEVKPEVKAEADEGTAESETKVEEPEVKAAE